MLHIIQKNDKKERYQSYEIDFNIDVPYNQFWFWKDTKESVDDFKKRIQEWKQQLDYVFDLIDWEELYRYDWKEKKEIFYTKKYDLWFNK
jgi:poly-gamma-glutamate capsule biosynthesis protein CapA/YwtB (metallophosphatase superfamily)